MSPSAQSGTAKPTPTSTAAAKMAAPKINHTPAAASSAEAKAASKMHRRSRSGCFTCRLRRKKCEEGKPACKACTHLGLRCDYKRPMWWSNGAQRREQKEMIKNVIKRTQLSKKAAQPPAPHAPLHHHASHHHHQPAGLATPPGLSHSATTASADCFPDSLPDTRAPSVCSPFDSGYDFAHVGPDGYFGAMAPPPHHAQPLMANPPFPMFASPYEVDIKTESQLYVNDVPTRKDSTFSTFSTFQQPPLFDHGMGVGGDLPGADAWTPRDLYESNNAPTADSSGPAPLTDDPADFAFFDFPHGVASPGHEAVIAVDDCDQYLLSHFFDKVLALIFPVLDANQHGAARTDVILPALESNRAYLHCCLSIAATHLKATSGASDDAQIAADVVRHRYAAVSDLCEALARDDDHAGILEATLGMIFFQCSVGRPDECLPDIPWHQHFQAAADLVGKLDLQRAVLYPTEETSPSDPSTALTRPPPFNMTLTTWIDILGATMLARPPRFADTYRELNMSSTPVGLSDLMGCDDKIMYLISEVACLDAQKTDGIDEVVLCQYVEILAREIAATENAAPPVESAFSASTGALRPRQLAVNLTAVFRVAARIYLCTLVPGFDARSMGIRRLNAQFADLMAYVPAGPTGFDRSLAWPLLVAGAASTADAPFRNVFDERCEALGEAAGFGSFGRIRELLRGVWEFNDGLPDGVVGTSWREVMRGKGWDFLLI